MAGDSDSTSKAPENSPMPEEESPPAPEGENESKSPASPPPSSDSEESKSPPPSLSSPPPPPPPTTPSTKQSTSTQDSPPAGQASPPPRLVPPMPTSPSDRQASPPPRLVPPMTTSPADGQASPRPPGLVPAITSPTDGQESPRPPGLVPAITTSPTDGQASPRPPGLVSATTTSPADGQASLRPPGLVSATTTTPVFSPPTTNNHLTSPTTVANGGRRGGEAQTTPSSKSLPFSGLTSIGIIAGVVVGIVLLILVAIVVVCVIKRKKRKKQVFAMTAPPPPYGWDGRTATPQDQYNWQTPPEAHSVNISTNSTPPMASSTGHGYSGLHSEPNTSGLGLGLNKITFRYEELAMATNGFNQTNMLGQGGFGYVHKGVLPDGRIVAVKSLKSGSGQGEREFMAEVEMLSRVHHRHLVSLVGYCIANGQRILVYDFLPNDTLEYHLHTKGDPIFDFPTRVRIALGSAKGLAYLHEDCHPRIIHRDIKASNILLDGNFEAMVADFGLAKLTSDTNTHVSTRVMGTFGYLAPEYAASGKLTEKSDVFSFGVMLLELITGRRPVDPNMKYMEDSLVDWSRPLMTKAVETGKFEELADPKLEGSYNPQEMKRMVACAAASIRHSAKKRPKMSQIVRVLQGDVSLEDLNDGTTPGQSSVYSSSVEGSDYDSRAYSADLKRFRQIAFESQGFASNEYGGGGSSSEDGLELSSSSSSEISREIKR